MIRFEKDSDGIRVSMVVDEEGTWFDLTDRFIEFMLGCGYVFDYMEVADYIKESYEGVSKYADKG